MIKKENNIMIEVSSDRPNIIGSTYSSVVSDIYEQFKTDNDEVISLDLNNNAICFEGNYLYHRASKWCKNQKRVMLSCQYVTTNSMSFVNQPRIKPQD